MAQTQSTPVTVDIIVPMFNEGEGCARFHAELKRAVRSLPQTFRFIYVNDGSVDDTTEKLERIRSDDNAVSVIELSRNFGHQAALTAGLDVATADVIIMMDGDGQHPPELIHDMLKLYEAGFEIVQAKRVDPAGSLGAFKKLSSAAFYLFLRRLSELDIEAGTADFRLITRDVANALRELHEYHRFIRGIIPWLGFRRVLLPFDAPQRVSGATKFTLRKMLRLAGDGLFSFSLAPLQLGFVLGCVFLCLGFAEVIYVASFYFTGRSHELVPGWSSLILMMTVSSGVTMLLLGFIGIYVGMIFQQVKSRPIYIRRAGKSESMQVGAPASVTKEVHAGYQQQGTDA